MIFVVDGRCGSRKRDDGLRKSPINQNRQKSDADDLAPGRHTVGSEAQSIKPFCSFGDTTQLRNMPPMFFGVEEPWNEPLRSTHPLIAMTMKSKETEPFSASRTRKSGNTHKTTPTRQCSRTHKNTNISAFNTKRITAQFQSTTDTIPSNHRY